MRFSFKKFFVYLASVFVLTVSVLGYLVYDELSDLENIKAMVVGELETLTHRKASIGEAELSFSEGASVRLKNFSLRSLAEGKPEFSARDVWVVVKLWPLLMNEVEIDKVIVRDAMVQVTRDDKGVFSFNDLLRMASHAAPQEERRWPELLQSGFLKKLEIRDGRFEFEDRYGKPEGRSDRLRVENVNFSFNKGFFSNPYRFELKGEIPHAEATAALNVRGKLKLDELGSRSGPGLVVEGQIKINDLSLPLIRTFIPHSGYFLVFDAMPEKSWVSLDSGFTADLTGKIASAGKMKYAAAPAGNTSLETSGKASGGMMEYRVERDPAQIRFKELSFRQGDFDFHAQAEIARWKTQNPHVIVSIRSNGFLTDKSKDYPALRLFPDPLHDALQKVFKAGALEIKELKFDGTLEQLKNLNQPENLKRLSVDLGMKHVNWTNPMPRFTDVTGDLRLQAGEATVDVQRAKYLHLPVAKLTGKILDMPSHPTIDFRAEGKVHLTDIKSTLMEILTNDVSRKLLDGYRNLKGGGYLVVRVQGPALDFDRIEISGDLQLDNAAFTQTTWNYPVTQLRGKGSFVMSPLDPAQNTTDFRPWLLRIHGVDGKYGRDVFSQMAGELNMAHGAPYVRMDGKFKLDPVSGLERLRASLPLDEKHRAQFKQAEFIAGDIGMDIHIEGNPVDDEDEEERGTLELANVSVKMPNGLPPLLNLFATVGFSRDKIQFENVRAYYGDSPFQFHGQILRGPHSRTRFDMYATFRDFYAGDFRGIPALEGVKYAGPARLGLSLRGQPENFRFENVLDLTRASYKYKDLMVKNADVPNTITVQGNYQPGKPVTVEKAEIVLGESKIVGKGVFNTADMQYQVALAGEDFKMRALGQHFQKLSAQVRGGLDLRFQANGNLGAVEDSRFQGEALFRDMVVSDKSLANPVAMQGRMKFSGDRYELVNMRMDTGSSHFEVSGVYSAGAAPAVDFNVSGQKLIWSDLFAEKKDFVRGLRATVDESDLLSRGQARIVVNLGEFDYKRLKLQNVSSRLAFKDRKLKIEKLDIHPPRDNRVRGQGTLSLEGAEGIEFEAYLLASGVRAENLASMLGDVFHDGLSGKVENFVVNLKAKGVDWPQIKQSLGGRMSFQVAGGEINPALMKKGVRDLFDVQDMSDTDSEEKKEETAAPYERIQGDFSIRQGVAQTQNFLYATANRSSTLVGWFDLNRNTMDTVVGVAPLPQLDKILVKIPVVGKIITAGDEESLVKTYYSVQGPFGNPQVSAIPFTSLERKVIGTFKGILQTPQEILTLPKGLSGK
jgi:uncharacterized protein YhdP